MTWENVWILICTQRLHRLFHIQNILRKDTYTPYYRWLTFVLDLIIPVFTTRFPKRKFLSQYVWFWSLVQKNSSCLKNIQFSPDLCYVLYEIHGCLSNASCDKKYVELYSSSTSTSINWLIKITQHITNNMLYIGAFESKSVLVFT